MPAGCRRCNPAEEYEGKESSCFLFIYLFYFLPPAASVSPLDRDKVTDLDLEKILSAFSIIFPFYSRHSIKKSIDKSEKIDYTFHWIVPKDMKENNSSQHMGHSWKQKRNR